jgi:hypothetical protein
VVGGDGSIYWTGSHVYAVVDALEIPILYTDRIVFEQVGGGIVVDIERLEEGTCYKQVSSTLREPYHIVTYIGHGGRGLSSVRQQVDLIAVP